MLATIAAAVSGRLRVLAMLFALAAAGGTGTAVALTAATGSDQPAAVASVDDDGTADQGPGDAPGTETDDPAGDDGTADQGPGDAPGTKTDDPADDQGETDTPATDACPNHGATVSAAAHAADRGPDAHHGEAVSAVARSHDDCDATEVEQHGRNRGPGNGEADATEHSNRGPQGDHADEPGDQGEDHGDEHAGDHGDDQGEDQGEDHGEDGDHGGQGSDD